MQQSDERIDLNESAILFSRPSALAPAMHLSIYFRQLMVETNKLMVPTL